MSCLTAFLSSSGFSDRSAMRTTGALIPIYGNGSRSLHRGRALLVGDAARLVDPFLGEGIYYAIQSGQHAAQTILAEGSRNGDLSSYRTAVSRTIIPELEAAGRLSRTAHRAPWLWFQVLKRRRSVIDLYRKVLTGEATYRWFEDQVWAGTPRAVVALFGMWAGRGALRDRLQES
jgi:flavin-dependent dehydrogenase